MPWRRRRRGSGRAERPGGASGMRTMDDRALIVVDVQNDFCPGGALAVAEGDLVVAAINRVAGGFPVRVLTQDWHPPHHRSFAINHGADPFTTVAMPYGEQVL